MSFPLYRSALVPLLGLLVLACDDGDHPGVPGRGPDAGGGGAGGKPPVELDAGSCTHGLAVDGGPALEAPDDPLRINEVMSANDGAWVDEEGETDDFIELLNGGDEAVHLRDYRVSDQPGRVYFLPDVDVLPGKTVLLWADDSPAQGELHLPFKLSASGTPVFLWTDDCRLVDHVEVPALPESESYARLPDRTGDFVVCRYATPDRINGETCVPPPPPNLDDSVTYADYIWPDQWPEQTAALVISELSLAPASFVEVLNPGTSPVNLPDFAVRLSAQTPGTPWPAATDGTALAWPAATATLGPGERIVVPVTTEDVAGLALSPAFEGVATVFENASGEATDRVDFMHWPEGSVLTRIPDASGFPRFCTVATPGAANAECSPLESRDAADRARSLSTPGDFDALAEGGTELGESAVKFVIDMNSGDVAYLLGTQEWALHYTWIREQIYKDPHLDRCNPIEAKEFNQGWWIFSQDEYFRVEERRFLLGTLIRHLNGLLTVEFTQGDAISAEQMRRAFFAIVARTPNPKEWFIRPTEGRQIDELRKVEGTVPIVGPNAPYKGITYQPLTATVGFGVLKFVPASELETAELGPNVIVVTDDVPNESAFMGGLVTEAFQTPLAHVNVLARSRNTPNMALRNAKTDPRVEPFFGKLVRLDVRSADFELREASAEEADAYWQARKPTGPKLVPPRDLSVRGIVPLETRRYADSISVGSKCAGVAELYHVNDVIWFCDSTSRFYVPGKAFGVPFAHYVDHFEASGAQARLAELEGDPKFRADPATHAEGLASVRQLMLDHPVDPAFLEELRGAVSERFGDQRVRFRSSSNTEDLATFNGAGLHTSTSAELDAESTADENLENAIRTVWSSLWNTRAYDERDFGNVDQVQAAMGVLVHLASSSEAAQGVAISRNALHATRSDQYYINAQIGEAAVTNPAPGVSADELVYTPSQRNPRVDYVSHSSLTGGENVLSFAEVQGLGCALGAIHKHFQPLVDPTFQNRLFAMQIEYKLLKPDRKLLVKQARPYTFGSLEVPQDCREF